MKRPSASRTVAISSGTMYPVASTGRSVNRETDRPHPDAGFPSGVLILPVITAIIVSSILACRRLLE